MRANKITNNGEVLLDLTQDTATPETVGEGVTFHTADGSPAVGTAKLGGGAELNIAYGDTAPEDTSKLWCKTEKPSELVVSKETESVAVGENKISTLAAKLPEILGGMICASVGKIIYVFGGVGSDYKKRTTIFRFDTETDTFTTLPTQSPKGLYLGVAGVFNTKIYMFGTYESEIHLFDTETETVTTLGTTVPKFENASLSCVIDHYIYTLTWDTSLLTNTVVRFDMETETLSTVTSFKVDDTCWVNNTVSAVGAKMYITGGSLQNMGETNIVGCFDTETNEFYKLSLTNPHPVSGPGSISVGDIVYIFGGTTTVDGYAKCQDWIWAIDTAKLSVLSIPLVLPTKLYQAGVAYSNNRVYMFGGISYTDSYSGKVDTIIRFDPVQYALVLTEGKIQIVPKDNENIFRFINTDTVKAEIGVDKVYKGNADGHGELVEAALYKDGAWTNI